MSLGSHTVATQRGVLQNPWDGEGMERDKFYFSSHRREKLHHTSFKGKIVMGRKLPNKANRYMLGRGEHAYPSRTKISKRTHVYVTQTPPDREGTVREVKFWFWVSSCPLGTCTLISFLKSEAYHRRIHLYSSAPQLFAKPKSLKLNEQQD